MDGRESEGNPHHVSDEVGLEQAYIDRLYERLDTLRARTARELASVRRAGSQGTHQNRSERDSFAALNEQRLAQLEAVEDRLAFGRVDLRDGARRYIGRIGLSDDEQTQLLVDWRAPAARGVLPGDRGRARRRRPAPPPRHPWPHGHRRRGRGARPRRALDGDPAQHADRRGRAARGRRRGPHRPDGRHRRDHPGRAGPGDPQRPGRRARRAGRPGHRQDRGRAAPRRVPALHATGSGWRAPACCSSGRTRCSCATSSRCCPRSARPAWSCRPRPSSSPASSASRRPTPRVVALKGDLRMGAGPRPRGARPRSGCPTRAVVLPVGRHRLTLSPGDVARRPLAGAPQPQAAQRGPRRLRAGPARRTRPAPRGRGRGASYSGDTREDLQDDLRESRDVRRALNLAWMPHHAPAAAAPTCSPTRSGWPRRPART